MRIERRFTSADRNVYDDISFRQTDSEIRNPDGSVVFEQRGFDVPAQWSQVACDVLAQKYFRKAGVPACLKAVPEEGVPAWLWRKEADAAALGRLPVEQRNGGEEKSQHPARAAEQNALYQRIADERPR